MSQQTQTFEISGMSCGHCVRAVEGALEKMDGVEVEKVEIGRATVRFDPARQSPDAIAAAIREEGYSVSA